MSVLTTNDTGWGVPATANFLAVFTLKAEDFCLHLRSDYEDFRDVVNSVSNLKMHI